MKRKFFLFISLILIVSESNGQLHTVTSNGNTTSNAIFINGANNYQIGNYNGLMFSYQNGAGYVETVNPGTGSYLPLWLRGAVIQTNNRLLVNNSSDDGTTAVQVNGGALFTGMLSVSNGQDIRSTSGFIDTRFGSTAFKPGVGAIGTVSQHPFIIATSGAEQIRILANGNTGIGTSSPANKFEVSGGGTATNVSTAISNATARITTANSALNILFGYDGADNSYVQSVNSVTTTHNKFLINPYGGNVGIGVRNPTATLSVNGDILARKVKVSIKPEDWPDYVFDRNYQLLTLKETEKFISINKHLPGIPSAEEVGKNGHDIGELNKQLLQKVEELTLHLIQQQKQITELHSRLKKVENK